MTVKIILAIDRDNAIGTEDGLPWHLPDDLKRFKALTSGFTVFMGRKTFESLNRPRGLPNRRNVILSSSAIEGVETTKSFDWILAHQMCLGCSPPDLWIIGGASVYAEALRLKLVDELYITKVNVNSGAPVKLPFELYSTPVFMTEQMNHGVQWTVVDSDESSSEYAYVTLKRIR